MPGLELPSRTAAAFAIVVATTIGCSDDSPATSDTTPAPVATSQPSTASASEPSSNRPSASPSLSVSTSLQLAFTTPPIPVGKGPVGITVADGSLWVALADDSAVVRLDPVSGKEDAHIPVGSTPLRLVGTAGGVWVSNFVDGTVSRIDTKTNKVTATVPVGPETEGIAALGDHIFVVTQQDAKLHRINAKTGKVDGSVATGAGPRLVIAADGALWVGNFGAGTISRVDPATMTSTESPLLCLSLQGMVSATAPGRLWVTCTDLNQVLEVDTTKWNVLRRIAVDGRPDAIVKAAAGFAVSTADPLGVTYINATTGEPTAAVYQDPGTAVTRANTDLVIVGETVWQSAYEDDALRTSPLAG